MNGGERRLLEPGQVIWASLVSVGALCSLILLLPLDERTVVANRLSNPHRRVRVRVAMLVGIFCVFVAGGVLVSPYVRLSTPIINHYFYRHAISWTRWTIGVGNAVLGGLTLLYLFQVVMHRVFRPIQPMAVVPGFRDRMAIILHDATYEIGVLYGVLSLVVWGSVQLFGSPRVFLSLCGTILLLVAVHLWSLSELHSFHWRLFWNTWFIQAITVFVFGTLIIYEGLEAGVLARGITVALFVWPRRDSTGRAVT